MLIQSVSVRLAARKRIDEMLTQARARVDKMLANRPTSAQDAHADRLHGRVGVNAQPVRGPTRDDATDAVVSDTRLMEAENQSVAASQPATVQPR